MEWVDSIMKIFIDSADLDEIKQFYAWGIADGVTTNPSLMKKAVDKRKKKRKKLNLKSYIIQILKIAKGTPVSLEVTKTTILSGSIYKYRVRGTINCYDYGYDQDVTQTSDYLNTYFQVNYKVYF